MWLKTFPHSGTLPPTRTQFFKKITPPNNVTHYRLSIERHESMKAITVQTTIHTYLNMMNSILHINKSKSLFLKWSLCYSGLYVYLILFYYYYYLDVLCFLRRKAVSFDGRGVARKIYNQKMREKISFQ